MELTKVKDDSFTRERLEHIAKRADLYDGITRSLAMNMLLFGFIIEKHVRPDMAAAALLEAMVRMTMEHGIELVEMDPMDQIGDVKGMVQ